MSELCLVTGGAGFIGSHVVDALLAAGYRVRVLDNFSTGHVANLPKNDLVEVMAGDVLGEQTTHAACKGVRHVFHLAARPSVSLSMLDPPGITNVNVQGTINMLWAARHAGVDRFVFSSSSSVYGDTEELPKVETMPMRPRSPYAASKAAGEHLCQAFHRCFGMQTYCLRYFNVYGPRQSPSGEYAAVVPRFLLALLTDEHVTIYGDGNQTRDFTYVADVAAANLACLDAHAPGQVFNIANGGRISLWQLLEAALEVVGGLEPFIDNRPTRPGDVTDSQAGIARALQCLPWAPGFQLGPSLRATVDWMKESGQCQDKG